jgi:hypothetical protein
VTSTAIAEPYLNKQSASVMPTPMMTPLAGIGSWFGYRARKVTRYRRIQWPAQETDHPDAMLARRLPLNRHCSD